MVKMYITVLLAIPVEKVKEKAERKSVKKEKKGSKGSKGSKAGSPSVPEETNPFVFPVGKASYFGHLEYNLFPNIPTFSVDITCWEQVAKIYTADGVRASKTIIQGNTCWVAFSLGHSLALTNEQILQLHEHQIEFNYWPSEKRVGQRAKSDHPTEFKALAEHVSESQIDFIELYDNDEQTSSPKKSFLNPLMGEIVSLPWAVPYEKHRDCSVETIQMSGENIKKVDTPPTQDTNVTSDARANKGGKRKSSTEGSEHMSASAGALFSDSQEARCHIKSSNVKFMLAIISAVDLMTPTQMVLYNPLMVNIRKLKGLPVEFLKENGYFVHARLNFLHPDIPLTSCGRLFHSRIAVTVKELPYTEDLWLGMGKELLQCLKSFSVEYLSMANEQCKEQPIKQLNTLQAHAFIHFVLTLDFRFKSLYIKYHVPVAGAVQTVEKKLEDTVIEFNDSRAIFTKDIPRVRLIEFVQTGYLLFEIYGVRDLPKQASVFGQEEMDEWIGSKLLHTFVSNCHQDLFPPSTTVLLGVAKVDLGDLMNVATRTILESVPVRLPKESFENGRPFHRNILEINEFLMRKYQGSPCTNLILSENNTRLKVSVKLVASLTCLLWELQLSSKNFNRLFAIIKDRFTALDIINEIYGSNERCLGKYIGVPNFCKGEASSEIPEEQAVHEEENKENKQNKDKEDKEDTLSVVERSETGNSSEGFNDDVANLNYERRRHQYLTGFAVDNFDSLLLFVEGPPAGKLQEIYQMLTEQSNSDTNSTVFYSSDLVFEGRLYEDFKPFGGLYTITLYDSIANTLAHYSAYQEERIPAPTFRALQQFNHLLKISDMAEACRNHYLPSVSDLLSFDKELGVPLKYKIET